MALVQSRVSLVVSGSLVFVWAWFLFPAFDSAFREAGDPLVIDLQFSWSVDRFVEIISIWIASTGQGAVRGLVRQMIVLDFAFPVVYAVFGASMLSQAWPTPRMRTRLILIPMSAAVADFFENILLIYAIRDMPPASATAVSSSTVFAVSSLATLKLQLLLTTIALVVIGLLYRLWMTVRRT